MFGNIKNQKRMIEKTYCDICNIYKFQKVTKGSLTSNEKVLVYENIPCALSQKTLKATEQTDSENKINYEIKLFISPSIEINSGAEIEVIHCGHKYKFKQAGEAFIYETHQEIVLLQQNRA